MTQIGNSTSPGGAGPAVRRVGNKSALAFDRSGSGEPLILLHGQGSSRRSWDPVVPGLTAEREVFSVDLPGHGQSPLDASTDHSPADLADSVAELMDDLGLSTAHIGGNSLGGWVALELAKKGRARTVTAFSPAGLWSRTAPAYIRLALRQCRLNARIIRRVTPDAPRSRTARALFFAQVSAHPTKVPYDLGRLAVHDMALTPGFRETMRGLESRRFEGGRAIRVPVTVVFGVGDQVLLPRSARKRDELPTHTRWLDLAGSGHMPMLDDPSAVSGLLLDGSGFTLLKSPA